MNNIKFSFLLLLSFLFISVAMQGQEMYHARTLILKLNKENALLGNGQVIVHQEFNDYLSSMDNADLELLFPHHTSPEDIYDGHGNLLVDLSLMYQLKYSGLVPEMKIVRHLESLGIFEYVSRRPLSQFCYTPNDIYHGLQYQLVNVKAFDAWDVEKGDSSIVIGITDSGTDRLHEDLQNIAYNENDTIDGIDNDNDGFIDNYYGWDLGSNDNNTQWWPKRHGIFVSGMSNATPDNGKGVIGTGFYTKFLPVKIDDTAGILIRDYEGIVYAADHGCAIVNCSWGGKGQSPFGQDIVNYATFNQDALVIAAAGNDSNDRWFFPASYDNVISVAGTKSDDSKAVKSSYGSKIDFAAPGESVYSTWEFDDYVFSSGTSFAAPMVAGAAALVKARFPSYTALQLGEQIRVSCDNIDTLTANSAFQNQLGSGRMNMYQALIDTTSPSFRLRNTEIEYKMDSIFISAEIVNYLQPSSSAAYAVLRSNSPYLSVGDSMLNLGTVVMLSSVNNYQLPFSLEDIGTPKNYLHDVSIHFFDTAYHSLEYVRLLINTNHLIMDTNLITTPVSSVSRVGYPNEDMSQSLGFQYKNSRSLMSISGLVFGNSVSRISDNIYNNSGGIDNSFSSQKSALYVDPPAFGDKQITSSFNDSKAGPSSYNIFVEQEVYAFDTLGHQNYILMDFTLYNYGFGNVNDLYVGYYVDWDIDNSDRNKAAYDSTNQLAYVWPSQGGVYGGLQGIEGKQFSNYQITNSGNDDSDSINIYDGFSDAEKYFVLSNRRDSAGFFSVLGMDVSSMISSGPYTLNVGDSVHVVFAIHAGDNLFAIKQSAQNALDLYHYVDDTYLAEISNEEDFLLYPNPASNTINIVWKQDMNEDCVMRILDLSGKKLYQETILSSSLQDKKHAVSIDGFPEGVYWIQIVSDSKVSVKKFIVHKQ